MQSDGASLSVNFGGFAKKRSHWPDDSFYARSPTWLTFDWLLTFTVSKQGDVAAVTVKHIGWDNDEKDRQFVRIK